MERRFDKLNTGILILAGIYYVGITKNHMKLLYILLIGCGLTLLGACSHSAKEDGLDHDHAHHENEHEESLQEKETGHEDEIILSADAARRFGVEVETLTPGMFAEVVKVSGQIIPAPADQAVASAQSSGILTYSSNILEGSRVSAGSVIATISAKGMAGGDANAAAKAAVDAAKRELERITPLHADGIVSTKDYNAARQAYESAMAMYSGSAGGSRVVSPIGGVITSVMVRQGEYVDAGQPIVAISKSERLTLKAELPEKYFKLLPSITTAKFRTAYSDSVVSLTDLNGRLLSSSSVTGNTQAGYIPVYFSFENRGEAVPGAFAEIYLIGTPRHDVLTVPVEAVTEQEGAHYVYVRLDEEGYQKRRVVLGISDGQSTEVLSGIQAGESLVTKGAVVVKMAESSGIVPEGHSHTH